MRKGRPGTRPATARARSQPSSAKAAPAVLVGESNTTGACATASKPTRRYNPRLGGPMIRRLAVLGLAVAMCATLVAGQTEYRLNEIPPDAQEMPANAMARLLQMVQTLRGHNSGAANPAQQLGPLVVSIELVGPKLTRLHLTQHGSKLATLESAAFTVTTGTDGTTITASNRVKMQIAAGRTIWTNDGFDLRTGPRGEILEATPTTGR